MNGLAPCSVEDAPAFTFETNVSILPSCGGNPVKFPNCHLEMRGSRTHVQGIPYPQEPDFRESWSNLLDHWEGVPKKQKEDVIVGKLPTETNYINAITHTIHE